MADILLIQLARLGDLIQSTPLLKDLMQSRPNDRIDVLVLDENRPILEGMPGLHLIRGLSSAKYRQVEELFPADQKIAPTAASDLLKNLDLPHFTRIINLTYSVLPCWLAGQMGCKMLEGGYINEHFEWLYKGAAHVYLAARLGFRDHNWFNLVDLWRSAAPGSRVPETGSRPYVSVAQSLPFQLPSGMRVALNPGSSENERRWPPAHFARLAERLSAVGLIPILVGAPADRDACAEVEANCSIALHNLCGRTAIPQMARLLAETRLLVSVDTGAVHFASCVGTPVVGLYGGTASFRETAPWSEGHLILQAPLEAELSQLQPDLVFAASLNRLGLLAEVNLRQDLANCRATAWETFFFPSGTDPVGGLGYRPIHQQQLSIEELFSRALRHVFAGDFCDSEAKVTLDYLHRLPELTSHSDLRCLEGELGERMKPVVDTIETIENLATLAARAVKRSRTARSGSTIELNAIVAELIRSLENLKAQSEQGDRALCKPVIEYLDWDFRMMPMLSPLDTFRYHQRRYSKTAAMLRQAAAATADFLAS